MQRPKFPTEDPDFSMGEPALTSRTRAMDPTSHDAMLQARIWDQLQATRELDSSQVSVVVRNRGASLFGTVKDQGQRLQMQQIAAGISGVLEVTNRLRVVGQTLI
jgi:osmotically-inducible protein OsmY